MWKDNYAQLCQYAAQLSQDKIDWFHFQGFTLLLLGFGKVYFDRHFKRTKQQTMQCAAIKYRVRWIQTAQEF